MTTSDLHSRLYPEPSRPLSRGKTSVMHQLHTMQESLLTAIYAQNAYCSSGSAQTSTSWLDPYLHRAYWHLKTADGSFIAGIDGSELVLAKSPNSVPHHLRLSTYERARRIWFELMNLLPLQNDAIAVEPIDYYAHRSTPHIWCALDD